MMKNKRNRHIESFINRVAVGFTLFLFCFSDVILKFYHIENNYLLTIIIFCWLHFVVRWVVSEVFLEYEQVTKDTEKSLI